MSVEIERKFLVRDESWRAGVSDSTDLQQGYLANTGSCSVRLRLAGGRAWLSVKAMDPGPARLEFEYEVPPADATEMLAALADGPLIEKRRHLVPLGSQCFEVDEFLGDNDGLVVAEIELAAAGQDFPRPAWLGDEVTMDPRFYNFRLAREPFRNWPDAHRRAVGRGENAQAPP